VARKLVGRPREAGKRVDVSLKGSSEPGRGSEARRKGSTELESGSMTCRWSLRRPDTGLALVGRFHGAGKRVDALRMGSSEPGSNPDARRKVPPGAGKRVDVSLKGSSEPGRGSEARRKVPRGASCRGNTPRKGSSEPGRDVDVRRSASRGFDVKRWFGDGLFGASIRSGGSLTGSNRGADVSRRVVDGVLGSRKQR